MTWAQAYPLPNRPVAKLLRSFLLRGVRDFHRNEEGQMALAMVLSFLAIFVIFGLALDAGVWYWDHRTAQNQADAAAQAAILELPSDGTAAKSKAQTWLNYNW